MPRGIRLGASIEQNFITMNIESLNSWSEALLIVAAILGIMALTWIGLCLINQKRGGDDNGFW